MQAIAGSQLILISKKANIQMILILLGRWHQSTINTQHQYSYLIVHDNISANLCPKEFSICPNLYVALQQLNLNYSFTRNTLKTIINEIQHKH